MSNNYLVLDLATFIMRCKTLRLWNLFTFLGWAYAGYNETELRLVYGSVVDWVHFSPRVDVRQAGVNFY